MGIIEEIYNLLKDKYKLTLTNTLALNEGYTINTPVIVGQNGKDRFELYSENGDEYNLVFLVFFSNPYLQSKDNEMHCSHWHPTLASVAIHGIETFMNSPYILFFAHQRSINNRLSLASSKYCGCFYCLKIYSPGEIKNWISDTYAETAVCPYCGIDSVLPESEEYPLNEIFLKDMNNRWF